MHCFLGEKMPSHKATWNLIKTVAENFSLPYFTLTPTFSICENHGYIKGEHSSCPECNSACEVWSRSVGYLRPVDQWNPGKQLEFKDRKTFDKQLSSQSMEMPEGKKSDMADSTPTPVEQPAGAGEYEPQQQQISL